MAERVLQAWVKKHANNIRIAIVLLFLGLAIWAITLVYLDECQGVELVIANSTLGLWLTVALTSVGPELAGIVIGVVTIDYLNEWRQDEQLKEQLILQMGSSHNDVTDTAIRALRARGWLSDGSLRKAFLGDANLSGARLVGANLSGAKLWGADLSGANLGKANLSGAYLIEANLTGTAYLDEANLTGAALGHAKLSGARLFATDLSEAQLLHADLSGAYLSDANLTGAGLESANLSGARLVGANVSGANLLDANLSEADLSGAKNWTIKQLEQAKPLEGAIMPDGVQLGGESYQGQTIEGPTFEAWKAQFLAKSKTEKAQAG